MNLHTLPKIKAKSKKRVGQGPGSGREKTAGRGMKGQKARNSVPLDFEGGALPLTKRLPFLRGKGRNKSFKPDPLVLNIKDLSRFSANETVDIKTLAEKQLVDLDVAKRVGVKILGDGEITVSLIVNVPASKTAVEKITKAGGKVASQ